MDAKTLADEKEKVSPQGGSYRGAVRLTPQRAKALALKRSPAGTSCPAKTYQPQSIVVDTEHPKVSPPGGKNTAQALPPECRHFVSDTRSAPPPAGGSQAGALRPPTPGRASPPRRRRVGTPPLRLSRRMGWLLGKYAPRRPVIGRWRAVSPILKGVGAAYRVRPLARRRVRRSPNGPFDQADFPIVSGW